MMKFANKTIIIDTSKLTVKKFTSGLSMLVSPFEIGEIKTKRNWGQFRRRNRNRNFVFLSFSKKRNRRNEIRGNFEIEISNEISFFYKF